MIQLDHRKGNNRSVFIKILESTFLMNKVKDETGSHGIGGLVLYKHRDACTTSV
jgi:hypothetical protein